MIKTIIEKSKPLLEKQKNILKAISTIKLKDRTGSFKVNRLINSNISNQDIHLQLFINNNYVKNQAESDFRKALVLDWYMRQRMKIS